MSKIIEIIKILESYELVSSNANMLLAEQLTAVCAAEEIEELFKPKPVIDKRKSNHSNKLHIVKKGDL